MQGNVGTEQCSALQNVGADPFFELDQDGELVEPRVCPKAF